MKMLTEVTAMSSRGQVVLPKVIRDAMSLIPGSRLMVFSDGDNILLKPIKTPDMNEFNALMENAAKWATEVGMQESDIDDAIHEVRKRRHSK